MRIIEDNYQQPKQEYEITCPHCKSKLAYTSDDVVSNEWIYCGVCGEQITIWEDNFPVADKILYPKDFFSYADSVSIKDAEIDKWVKECVNDLDKDNDYSFMASGDTIVFAFKSDEDVSAATVIVAKKYQETDVKISRKNF